MARANALSPVATAQFNDTPVSVYQFDSQSWLPGPDIGRCLGFKNPSASVKNIFNRHREELDPLSRGIKLIRRDGKPHTVRVFNEQGAYIVAMFASTPKAKAVRLWLSSLPKMLRACRQAIGAADRSTVEDRKPLETVCNLLTELKFRPKPVKRDYATVRSEVSRYMGVKAWREIPAADVPRAVAFVQKQIDALTTREQTLPAVREPDPMETFEAEAGKALRMITQAKLAIINLDQAFSGQPLTGLSRARRTEYRLALSTLNGHAFAAATSLEPVTRAAELLAEMCRNNRQRLLN